MLDFLVGAGLALLVQPSVADGAIISCQASAAIIDSTAEETLCHSAKLIDGELRFDGQGYDDFELGTAPRVTGLPGQGDETFWAMSHADRYIIGSSSDGYSRAAMVHWTEWAREGTHSNYDWRREEISCGRYGPQHVFGFSHNGRFAVIGYSSEGQNTLCRLDFETMTQYQIQLRQRAEPVRLQDIQLTVAYDGLMVATTPDGEEILRDRPEPPAINCGRYGEAIGLLGITSQLCGISVGEYYLRMDGRTIAPSPYHPGLGLRERPEIWVVRQGDYALVGVRTGRRMFDIMMMVSKSGPRRFAPVYCGPNPVISVSGFEERDSRFLDIVGQGWENTRFSCRLDFQEWVQTIEVDNSEEGH
ncbi:hypothetical protein [Maricaulis sp.]|uniref:hypothetical protein n=1 Tax=Maricaulis sp. TaxID=1486257 RepID=UPI001B199FC1|nr:hypothetical protein [Maricaulis sp.]MBO6797009.1 hypothetical protein [Maricaulis sp.]